MALPLHAEDLDPVTGLCIPNLFFNQDDFNSNPNLICPLLPKATFLSGTGVSPDTIALSWNDNSDIEAGYEIQTANDPTNGPWVKVKNGSKDLWPSCISDPAPYAYDCSALIKNPPLNPGATTPIFVPADATVHWYRVRPVFPGKQKIELGPGLAPEIDAGPLTGLLHGPWSDIDPAMLGPLPPLNLSVTVIASNPPGATISWQNQAAGDPTFCDNWLYRSVDAPQFGNPVQRELGFANSTIDSGLAFSKTYFYTVRAVRCKPVPLATDADHIEEAYSNAIPSSGATTGGGGVIIITPPPPPPSAPAGLSILPVCPDRAELLWFDPSTNEEGFLIEWGPTPTQFNQQTSIGPRPGTGFVTFLHIGIPADATRYYRVKSYRTVIVNGVQQSQISAPTNVAAVTVAPKAPTNLRVTVNLGSGVTLNWNDNAKTETGYRIERCTIVTGNTCNDFATVGSTPAVGVNSSGGTGSFADISVSGNTRYLYRVFTFNASCDGVPSNLVDVTTPPAPLIPPVLQTTVGHAHWIQLIWGDAITNGSTAFRIEYKDPGRTWRILSASEPGASISCPVGLTGNCKRYDDLSVPGMTTRCYRVRAIKNSQISDPSNEACGTTPAGPKPPAPTNLVGGAWGPCPITNPPGCDPTHAVQLTWTDNSEGSLEEDGFIVEHSKDGQTGWKVLGTVATDVTLFRYGSFEPASTQFFRVRAFNFEGMSGYSNTVQVKLLGPSRPIWLNPSKTDTIAASACSVDGKYVLGEGTTDLELTIVRKIAAESNSYHCTTAPGSCEFNPNSITGIGDVPQVNQVQMDWNGPGTFRLDFYFRKNVTYELHAKAINNHGASADAPIWSFIVAADCPLGSPN
jgi:hypothetical protein